jgi:hypothetical protein
MTTSHSPDDQSLGEAWDKHLGAEFAARDAEATIATMTATHAVISGPHRHAASSASISRKVARSSPIISFIVWIRRATTRAICSSIVASA